MKRDPFLITDNFQLIQLKRNSDISNLPVISNANFNSKSNGLGTINSDELTRAFKIIDAAKIVNEEMYKRLTEINLRYGGDVILRFSGITFPVIFGKGLEAKKIVILSSLWNGLNEIEDSPCLEASCVGRGNHCRCPEKIERSVDALICWE